MPLDYIVLHEGTFVYTKAYGVLTDDDLISHEQELAADPHVAPGFRQLIDCRWVVDDRTSDALLSRLARTHTEMIGKIHGARYAIVAYSDRWFEMGALYRCDQFRMTLIVFNEPSTACIWLGVDPQTLLMHNLTNVPTLHPAAHTSYVLAQSGSTP